jgi:hypothetical protein
LLSSHQLHLPSCSFAVLSPPLARCSYESRYSHSILRTEKRCGESSSIWMWSSNGERKGNQSMAYVWDLLPQHYCNEIYYLRRVYNQTSQCIIVSWGKLFGSCSQHVTACSARYWSRPLRTSWNNSVWVDV